MGEREMDALEHCRCRNVSDVRRERALFERLDGATPLLIFSSAQREVPYVWAMPRKIAEEQGKLTRTVEQDAGWLTRVVGRR